MPTLKYVNGFESRVITADTTTTANRVCTAVQGTGASIVVGPLRAGVPGARALQILANAGGDTKLQFGVDQMSSGRNIGRIYFKVDAFPAVGAGDDDAIGIWGTFAVNFRGVLFTVNNGGVMKCVSYDDAVISSVTGPTLTLGTVYRLDWHVNMTGTTHTASWQVDGVAQTALSQASRVAQTDAQCILGAQIYGPPFANYKFDDLVMSETAADYPIGEGFVEMIAPDGFGTHATGASFQDAASVAITGGGGLDAWLDVDEWPGAVASDADYITQVTANAAHYAEITLGAVEAGFVVHGAAVYAAIRNASAAANNPELRVIDEDAVSTTLYSGAVTWPASLVYRTVALPTPAGGWDAAAVDALKVRFGYASDVTPNPWLATVGIEVAYGAAAVRARRRLHRLGR